MSNSIKEILQAILDEASEKIEQSDALDKLNDEIGRAHVELQSLS